MNFWTVGGVWGPLGGVLGLCWPPVAPRATHRATKIDMGSQLGLSWGPLGTLLGDLRAILARSWRLSGALGTILGPKRSPKTSRKHPRRGPRETKANF